MNPTAGIILAGGLARRMGGGDKALLRVGDKRLIDHVLGRLSGQVDRVGLSANGDPARFSDLGLPVLADSIAQYPGPLAGVLAGLDWGASIGARHVVTVAADTPFFPRDLVDHLQRAAKGNSARIVLAATRDSGGKVARQPTFGLWPVALRDNLRDALEQGVRKVVIFTESHDAATAVFEDETGFFNVNTPQDLAQLQARQTGTDP